MTVISLLLAVLTVIGIRLHLNSRFKDSYRKDQIIANMQLLEGQVEAVQLPRAEPNPVGLDSNQSRLDRIKKRGIIRIGFNPDRLPFSYRNPKGELVGFDVDLVHHLALDLGVTIEFVPGIDLRTLGFLCVSFIFFTIKGVELIIVVVKTFQVWEILSGGFFLFVAGGCLLTVS